MHELPISSLFYPVYRANFPWNFKAEKVQRECDEIWDTHTPEEAEALCDALVDGHRAKAAARTKAKK